MLYCGTDDDEVKKFETSLCGRFNLDLMGQAHQNLWARFSQLSTLKLWHKNQPKQILFVQSQEVFGNSKMQERYKHHTTPLPPVFPLSVDDCSINKEASKTLNSEYKIIIFLSHHDMNKLHFEMLSGQHLLNGAPLKQMLISQNLTSNILCYCFSDSSWNNDQDTWYSAWSSRS